MHANKEAFHVQGAVVRETKKNKKKKHTCLNSSRVGTRRGRGGGKFNKAELVADPGSTAAAAAAIVVVAVVVMGALASGSVMLVSWDVLMVEVSKRELASGEMDRRAEGCDAGGESCLRVSR